MSQSFPWPTEQIARYTAYRTAGPIVVDGALDERSWALAPRSPRFADLVETPGLITQGVPGVPQDPLASPSGPRAPSPDFRTFG